MRAPITLDLHITNFNHPETPADRLFELVSDIAATAEESGFSSISVMDHLHQIAPMGPPENWMLEGNLTLAALAARTRRVSLGLLVGGVTYRNPALHAKMTTTLDVISGGRAIHGLGAAWFEAEHDAYGVRFPPLKERFEHLEDALRIARAMFTEEKATVEGTHHHVTDVMNNPRPIRGDIPILIGGSGERKTLRLVARYGDGCNLFGDPERARHLLGVLDGHCEAVGRDPAEITGTAMATVIIAPTHEAVQSKLDAAAAAGIPRERLEAAMSGDPDTIAERAQAYADVGIQGLTIVLPDVHDLETVALAGRTLGPMFG
ncbi:MAG: LLM class F420-dependent oxidoreductase [Solirubrobacteraceae bacterium]